MKAWKAIALAAFASIVLALIATTAVAYNAAEQTTNGPNGGYVAVQASRGGMMYGAMGGLMRLGYSQCRNDTSSNGGPQQSSNSGQYGSWTCGCGMRNDAP